MRTRISRTLLALVAVAGAAASGQAPAEAQAAAINLSAPSQVIDGFGGSTAWSGAVSDAVMDTLYGNANNQQIGLTLLRVRIDPNRNWSDEAANARKAHARGAKVLGTPWTPPAVLKTNNNTVAGELKPDQYCTYAQFLHDACVALSLDYCSVQNEPDIKVGYESCTWNAEQIHTFCLNNASQVGKPVVAPESYQFHDSLIDPTLDDPAAAKHVAVVGGHIYGDGLDAHRDVVKAGKHLWMTEHYINGSDIATCCRIAQEMNECMNDGMSAYVWWYLVTPGCELVDHGTLLKSGDTVGQFAKFIRPGYHRVGTTYSPVPNVTVTAYVGPHGKAVVVAVNTGETDVSQKFTYQGRKITQVTPTRTSATESLATLAPLPVTDASFTATLPAQSITTYVN